MGGHVSPYFSNPPWSARRAFAAMGVRRLASLMLPDPAPAPTVRPARRRAANGKAWRPVNTVTLVDTAYLSTRGKAPVLAFDDVLLTGLARDGGQTSGT